MRIIRKVICFWALLFAATFICCSTAHQFTLTKVTEGFIADNSEKAATTQEKEAIPYQEKGLPGNDVDTQPVNNPQQPKEPQKVLDEALEFCQASQDYWSRGDLENAIVSLDQAFQLILQVDPIDDPELSQQKDDIRLLISKRVLEIYASRHTAINGNHDAIPLVDNPEVQKEIEVFKTQHREFFLNGYKRSGRYLEFITKELTQAGLPVQLAWLPLIESGFNIKAMSRSRALGLWQFIPSTGYRFGLKRDKWIDERMNPIKSTKAALSYLQELHQVFGDWNTVLAAYNCGESKVLRIIREQNINYLDNFWDLYDRLPRETRRYVPRFLATLSILNNPEKYSFTLGTVDVEVEHATVTIIKQVEMKEIAKLMEIPVERLEDLNPELKYSVTPPTNYELTVPAEKKDLLVAKIDELPQYSPPERKYIVHRIQQGETLLHVAQRYHVSVNAITKINRIRKDSLLQIGQRLTIPLRTKTNLPEPKKQQMPSSVRKTTVKTKKLTGSTMAYRVCAGDSLWLIAQRFQTDVDSIVRLNNLKTNYVHIDQELLIPKVRSDSDSRKNLKPYHVKPGDSPYQIAVDHDMKLEELLRVNHISPKSKIFPGQTLLVEEKD